MEEERARALLREERQRLERLLASVGADHDRVTPADQVAEDLADGADRRTGEETDEAVAHAGPRPMMTTPNTYDSKACDSTARRIRGLRTVVSDTW